MDSLGTHPAHILSRAGSRLSTPSLSQVPNLEDQLMFPRETNVFGGTISIEELLKIFDTEGLRIIPEFGEAALQACANLEYQKVTQEDFLNVMKEYCMAHKHVGTAAAAATGAMPLAGAAAFGLMLALVKVSNAIKDRAQTAKDKVKAAELRARYLRGLATADNLSLEATNIAIVVSELIARGLDDHETMNLSASSNATIQLLREDLLPYLKSLSGREPAMVKINELRQKRWELKQRLIRQYEIVNIHYNRVQQGLLEMKAGLSTYYTRTNRLPAYARECLLEIHLRAWYAMLGYFDPDNTMIEYDDRNVGVAASDKIWRIQNLFEEYTTARLGMLKMRYENKRHVKGISKHEHTVYLSDQGAEGDTMVPKLSMKQLIAQSYISCSEPEGGQIEHFPDGSCEIWNDTMFSGEDRVSGLGRYIDANIRKYVGDQLNVEGPVWTSSLGFVNRMRKAVQPALPDRPALRSSMTIPPDVSFLQRQQSQGYCVSLSDSMKSTTPLPSPLNHVSRINYSNK
ncbi:hypothetical protein H2198_006896 [Neophaeococcomyces mojaviensis]|uniref:Uncharacterized protein n=1 Tax=Neophaeococcomyces mojaviensis TaxID=3383035 RepID=A0ACC3A1L8_9EURO|nr:hypothetical protein H2198_006896 [Knufia sp. JES_112]